MKKAHWQAKNHTISLSFIRIYILSLYFVGMLLRLGYIHENEFEHGPLTRYVKLRVAHASGMSETFFPPPTPKETASWRSRAWRTCRDACRDRWPAVAEKTFSAFPACLARGPYSGARNQMLIGVDEIIEISLRCCYLLLVISVTFLAY